MWVMWRRGGKEKEGLEKRGKGEEGVEVGGIGRARKENRGRRPRTCMWHSVRKWYVFNYVWRGVLRDLSVRLRN